MTSSVCNGKNNLSWTNKILIFLGDFFDHGDLYFFIAFMPLIGPIFFSSKSLIEPWLLYWLSTVLAYPFGSWVFGSMAQKISLQAKKNQEDPQYKIGYLLSKIFLGLSLTTFAMGFLPPQKMLGTFGFISPLLLLLCRTLQCFFARGQRTIGKLFLLSHGTFAQNVFRSMAYEIWTLCSLALVVFLAAFLLEKNISWMWRFVFWGFGFLEAILALFFLKISLRLQTHKEKSSMGDNISPSIIVQEKNPIQKILNEENNSLALMLGHISPVFLWASMICIFGFGYVTYSFVFHFLPQFIPMVTPLKSWEILNSTGIFFLWDIVFVVMAFMGILFFRPGEYKETKKEQKESAKSLFLFLSKIMKNLLAIWVIGLPTIFLGLYIFPPLICFTVLRFFVIVLGVFYSACLYLWSKVLFHALNEDYKTLGVTQSIGILLMGHSFGFCCHGLFFYIPLLLTPGFYGAFLGLIPFLTMRKLIFFLHGKNS